MKKLLREVPTMESWLFSTGKSAFIQVALDQEYVNQQMDSLRKYTSSLLIAPKAHADKIGKKIEPIKWRSHAT